MDQIEQSAEQRGAGRCPSKRNENSRKTLKKGVARRKQRTKVNKKESDEKQ